MNAISNFNIDPLALRLNMKLTRLMTCLLLYSNKEDSASARQTSKSPVHPRHQEHLRLSFRFPPNLPNPLRKSPHILPLHQPLHSKELLRQLLPSSNPMHKTMTRPTQPSHVLQLILRMPSSLQNLCVNIPRYQMVICQRNPGPVTDLTFCCLEAGCAWWRGRRE